MKDEGGVAVFVEYIDVSIQHFYAAKLVVSVWTQEIQRNFVHGRNLIVFEGFPGSWPVFERTQVYHS